MRRTRYTPSANYRGTRGDVSGPRTESVNDLQPLKRRKMF